VLSQIGEAGYEPMNLSNLKYDDIANFMNSKKNVCMVSKELADSWNSSKGVARNRKKRRRKSSTVNLSNGEEVGIGEANEKVEVLLPQGASNYGAIQSAVSFLYRECKVEMPKMMKDSISNYVKDTKRLCRRMKQALALKITEGK